MMMKPMLEMMSDMVLPTIKFFEPTPKFLDWAKEYLKDCVVFDCGAGSGWLGHELKSINIRCLGIDLLQRDKTYSPVLTGVDVTGYVFPNTEFKRVAIIARPNRGLWIEQTIDNASMQGVTVIYIGIPSHFEEDLEGRNWDMVCDGAGLENEQVFVLKEG